MITLEHLIFEYEVSAIVWRPHHIFCQSFSVVHLSLHLLLVRIFPHSGWIRRDTLDNFHAVWVNVLTSVNRIKTISKYMLDSYVAQQSSRFFPNLIAIVVCPVVIYRCLLYNDAKICISCLSGKAMYRKLEWLKQRPKSISHATACLGHIWDNDISSYVWIMHIKQASE